MPCDSPQRLRCRGMELGMRFAVVFASVSLALVLTACSGDGKGQSYVGESEEIGHVHGVDVDPRSEWLYVATHGGLLRARPDDTRLELVGESRQDFMGFSTTDAGRFVASGHPAAAERGQPHQLGLIESEDEGQSWTALSLYGQVDFHALEASGPTLYGVDATRGRMLFSANGGRRWSGRETPAVPLSLAIDPANSRRVIIATEVGLYLSADEARSWRRVSRDRTGLVSWPSPRRIHLLGADGTVEVSSDAGRRWTTSGVVTGGRPTAFDAEKDAIYVALEDGSILRSTDGGRGWEMRARP